MNRHHNQIGGIAEISVTEAAASWYDRRVDQPEDSDLQAALDHWLAEAVEHRIAYAEVSRTWAFAKSQAADPRILALRHEAALRLTRTQAAKTRQRPWAIAAASLAGCALGILLWPAVMNSGLQGQVSRVEDRRALNRVISVPAQTGHGRYLTAQGERLTTRLEDGSQVTLNAETELETLFTSSGRQMVLKRGQAYFEVAKDRNRPFAVDANGRRFIALGTAFDIRVEHSRVQVTITEGTVKVEAAQVHSDRTVRQHRADGSVISAGEQLTIDREAIKQVFLANAPSVASWRLGQVIFEDSRLSDAVAELNRYSKTKIRLEPASLGELHISGAFVTGDPKLFVEALTAYFPIRVSHGEAEVLLQVMR